MFPIFIAAVVLLRITHFWRICGVIHSDLKYMDDELRAKPTPDKNPLLGRKINMLYRLLVRRHSTSGFEDGTPVKGIQEMENETSISNIQSPSASSSSSSAISNSKTAANSFNTPNCSSLNSKDDDQKLKDTQNERTSVGNQNNGANVAADDDDDDDDDVVDVSEIQTDESYFENIAMRLRLPIPVTMKQRLLMLNVGDDFTHVWFPTWRKFLSKKRILNSFVLAKKMGKAFEMSQRNYNPKVFVSPKHDNCIFIGPYGNNDRQNLALFTRHNDHMVLSETYHKKFNATYTKKTKGERLIYYSYYHYFL